MATLTRSITIEAPVEEVFDFALDIGKVWIWPDVALREIVRTPEGVGSSARMYSHVLGIHVEGVIEYTEVVRPERIVATVGFGPEHPTWVFTFEPADGGTKLTLEGEWHVNIPGVGKPIEGLIVREHVDGLERMLAAVKTTVESKAAA